MRHSLFMVRVLTAILAIAAGVRAQSAQPEGFAVTASVDRPAIWVADRLTYTVEIVCPRGYDVLAGDLARDKLKLTGLEVVSADSSRREEAGVTRYRFDYVLTTYRVDVATPKIGSFPVRYYLVRAGQRPEEAAPAGSIAVPEVMVAFRSLLPDDQAIYDARDGRAVATPSVPLDLLAPAGFALIIISIVPAALLVARLALGIRDRRRAMPHSSRHSRAVAREALDELRAIDAADPSARREAFARLDALVRQHLTEVCGVYATGMTPGEIEAALAPCAARVPVELVASVLASSELARYANPELQPTAEAWRAALDDGQQILGKG